MVEKKLYVNRSASYQGEVGKTKTLYSERVIKLPQSVYEVLIERSKTSQSEWIFPHPKDMSKPMPGDIALRRLRKILESAGLPHIRFHDLRHTFATHAVSAGIDPKTLSSILGHSKASFSLDRYGHVTAGMQKGAAKTMGRFFEELVGEEVAEWQKAEENHQNLKTEDGELGFQLDETKTVN
jgi:integrase